MSCPFCDLSQHEIIYQDDFCFGVVILEPVKDGHLMVLPKRHVETLSDLKPEESKAIADLLDKFKKALMDLYDDDPMILMNTGSHGTQPHIHIHILPSRGGLRDLFAAAENTPFRYKATKEELKKIGDKIRGKIQ